MKAQLIKHVTLDAVGESQTNSFIRKILYVSLDSTSSQQLQAQEKYGSQSTMDTIIPKLYGTLY